MSFTKEVLCDLTDEEIREYSEQMAQGVQNIECMKEAQKIEIKQRNIEILDLQKEVNNLADKVINHSELRLVDLEWQKRYEDATIHLVRLDTMEIIESRPMNEDERQMCLPAK